MAAHATAQETLVALRRQIARIEGVPDRQDTLSGCEDVRLRRNGELAPAVMPLGIERFDAALGGGIPLDALTEIHSAATREAASASGFALALAGMAMRRHPTGGPVLWIGTRSFFHEAGMPYLPGIASRFGIAPGLLLVASLPRPEDVLRAAEDAARVPGFPVVILELQGDPRALDLTATRRLQHRAQEIGHPVFMLRQATEAQPTAARLRLLVSPGLSAPRRTLAGPLPGSIGAPVFRVGLDRTRTALTGQFLLEWNGHERAFRDRRPEDSVPLVPLSPDGSDPARPTGAVLAFKPVPAAGDQPSRPRGPAHLRPRRAV